MKSNDTKLLDYFNCRGIAVSLVEGKNKLCLNPEYRITSDVSKLVSGKKAEIIAEVRATGKQIGNEIVPNYKILWVATDLETFEDNDPRIGFEACIEAKVYRMLSPEYFAWLRSRVVNAKKLLDKKRIKAETFEELKQRFAEIAKWAEARFGKDELKAAMANENGIKGYILPSEKTYNALKRSDSLDAQSAMFREQLNSRGYAVIWSTVAECHVVFCKDSAVAVPEAEGSAIFTMDEARSVVNIPEAELRTICDVKRVLGGIVEQPVTQQMITQQSLSGDFDSGSDPFAGE